jgi:hypothetical protein
VITLVATFWRNAVNVLCTHGPRFDDHVNNVGVSGGHPYDAALDLKGKLVIKQRLRIL